MTTLPMAPTPDGVTCALCGFVYTPGGDSCKEHGCPIAFGTCATQHCPNCGYTMPDDQKSPTVAFFRKLFARRQASPPGTLAQAVAGATAVIARLEGDPELQARLTAQGLAPGVSIHILQRQPTFVIEVGETTIAVESKVAQAIVVEGE